MTTKASPKVSQTREQSAKDSASQIAGTAKDQTSQVAGAAKEQVAGVAGTVKEQALDVAHDAAGQARNLLDELRQNVRQQVSSQRSNLAQQLDGYASELRQMADRSESDGPATEAVRQIASRIGDVKAYLDGDGDVASDVRRLARRRPGAFLLTCAAAGVLAGRATRGAAAARKHDDKGRHVLDVRDQEPQGDISRYRTSYPGEAYRTRTYGAADEGMTPADTYGTDPAYDTGQAYGVERTSDPNLRATTGPLAGSTSPADPVPPDLAPGPTGLDEEISRAGQESTTHWERGER